MTLLGVKGILQELDWFPTLLTMAFVTTIEFMSTFCFGLFLAKFEQVSLPPFPNLMFAFVCSCDIYIEAHFDNSFDTLLGTILEEIAPQCSFHVVELCDSCTSSI